MSAETIITVVVIMAYVVGRQLAGEPLRVKRLIGLPVALTVIGIIEVATSKDRGPTRDDIVLIVVGLTINAVIGIGQGRLMRLESRHGYLWGQMPTSVLWWWAAKIGSGIVLDGIGHALGAQLATIAAVMLLQLGVNRLAQATIVARRAFATGIPFSPEPDNSGAGLKDQLFSEENRLPATSPTDDDPSGSRIRPPGTFDPSTTPPPTDPPTSLLRQISQMLLREINARLNDAVR
jgi:hypothetical protein